MSTNHLNFDADNQYEFVTRMRVINDASLGRLVQISSRVVNKLILMPNSHRPSGKVCTVSR